MRLGKSMVIYITADQNFDFVKNVNEFFKGVFLSFWWRLQGSNLFYRLLVGAIDTLSSYLL